MAKVFSASRLPGLVAVGLVLFAFWPALLGGGSLIAGDFVYNYAAPFDYYQSDNFSLEDGFDGSDQYSLSLGPFGR